MTQIFAEMESGGGDSERVCRNSLQSVFPRNLNLNPHRSPLKRRIRWRRSKIKIKIEKVASLRDSAKSAVNSCIIATAGARL